MTVSGNELNDIVLRMLIALNETGALAFAATLHRTPHGGGAMIVGTKKPTERVALKGDPRLMIVFGESVQINKFLTL